MKMLGIYFSSPVQIPSQKRPLVCGKTRTELFSTDVVVRWSFLCGAKVANKSRIKRIVSYRNQHLNPSASWILSSEVASNSFTIGTVAVLPFYTLMLLAPNAQLTKRSMKSNIPYITLGTLYAYLFYISCIPDSLGLMFTSKYWLPELPAVAKMFSNDLTLASVWIHLLTVDLFAARQIFYDGLKNDIETRHSICLCLLFCPLGIAMHFITKILCDQIHRFK